MSSSQQTLRLERIERLEDFRDDWMRLAEGAGHPFATWEWNSIWWRRFGEGRELYGFACRDEGDKVVAILPLYVAARRPVRTARFLGYGGLQSPVCLAEHRDKAAAGLWEATRQGRGGCRVLLAELLPGWQGWGELLGGNLMVSGHDPVVRFDGKSWEEVIGEWKGKLRGNLRRRERRLVEERGLTYRLADDPQRLSEDLDTLFRLHSSRWGEQTTGVFDGERGEFHREFAAEALRRGWLRLWLAQVDGADVAAWYGWRFAGGEWYYQAGRDPSFDRDGLGTVLLVHTMRAACEDGVEAYHFLGGAQEEEFKQRFANDDLESETRLLASGFAGRIGAIAISAGEAMPESIRRRMLRVSG